MKAIYRIIIAAATATLALVSCSKELNSPDKDQTGGLGEERVITLTFEGSTKSEISGLHPSFKDGDKVLLSNGGSKEECTVSIDIYGNATVTTTLTGTLKAVYPSSAAVLSGNAITGVQVSSTQHGTFAEANIAMAENIIPGGMARFKLKTAVLRFYVDQPIGVKSIKITSEGADIASDGGGKTISVTPLSPATTLYEMTTDHPDRRVCYVAVLPGVTASDLTFTSVTTSQGTVTRHSPGTATLAVKGMYDAFIPYYIKIHIGPGENDFQRWGYCNIGAFLPEEYGDYFAWGDIQGQTWNGSSWSGGGFSWALCPHTNATFNETTNKNVFTKYIPAGKTEYWGLTGAPDNKLVLELEDDAANVNWGTDWHMPTGGTDATADFNVLINTCQTISASSQGVYPYSSKVISGDVPSAKGIHRYAVTGEVAGVYFIDGEGNKLFFPLAGLVENTTYYYVGSNANYWSNTLKHDVPQAAYYLQLPSETVRPLSDVGRLRGGSIRPIYKTPADPLDIGEYDEPENIE